MADMKLTRRAFFGITAGGALALYLPTAVGSREVFAAPIPGGSLSPRQIPKFRAPLVRAPGDADGCPRSLLDRRPAVRCSRSCPRVCPPPPCGGTGRPAHPLDVPLSLLHRGGQKGVTGDRDVGQRPHRRVRAAPAAPAARRPHSALGEPARWGRWPRQQAVVHLRAGALPRTRARQRARARHGTTCPDWSDGYAEAWFLPDAVDIPSGYATEGTWHDFFAAKAAAAGLAWGPGRVVSNSIRTPQVPSTLWYHDHVLGMTRLNVYAGPAGFWLLRSDDPADNPTVAGSGAAAVLPGPAPQVGDPPRERTTSISCLPSRTVLPLEEGSLARTPFAGVLLRPHTGPTSPSPTSPADSCIPSSPVLRTAAHAGDRGCSWKVR